MFDFLNGPYVERMATYDPIIIISGKVIHIHIKHISAEFHQSNNIFKPIIIAKHMTLRGPILDLEAIMNRP